MQHWLQDFAYTPWVTTLFIGGLSGIALLFGKEIPATKLIVASAILASFSGFATEVWDTYWALQLADSFMSAIDVSDYGAFAWGAAVTCTIFAKRVFMGMES